MKLHSLLLLAGFAGAALAQDATSVRWQRINGVITAPGINNPVAGIASGGLPWSTTSGSAGVNFRTGNVFFFVEGLVFAGGLSIGTPGAVANVTGTLVCNAGTANQQILDTPVVTLSPEGNAQFSGVFTTIPTCTKPIFLIRAGSHWIAAGAVPTFSAASEGN
jgi:hypothetical protein